MAELFTFRRVAHQPKQSVKLYTGVSLEWRFVHYRIALFVIEKWHGLYNERNGERRRKEGKAAYVCTLTCIENSNQPKDGFYFNSHYFTYAQLPPGSPSSRSIVKCMFTGLIVADWIF